MKKKQVIAIAAVLAVVLLTSTAVYAIGNFGLENPPANAPVETPINTAEAGEIEAVQTLTAEQVDISEFSVPLGTKAEQILRDTLTKKQMTEQEIDYYNSMPDSIKQLTYEEARAKQAELQAEWDAIQNDLRPWDEYTEAEKLHIGEVSSLLFEYKGYADAIATGIEQAKVMHEQLKEQADMWLSYAVLEENWDLSEYERQFNTGKKAIAEFYLVVLEDMDEKLKSPNADGDGLFNDMTLMYSYKEGNNFADISPELMAEYTQRYQSGESIESILG